MNRATKRKHNLYVNRNEYIKFMSTPVWMSSGGWLPKTKIVFEHNLTNESQSKDWYRYRINK